MKDCSASFPDNAGDTKQKRFRVYKTGEGLDVQSAYTRRDFAKIFLTSGQSCIYSEGRAFRTNDPILFFEPHGPYSLNEVASTDLSFACLFSKDLLESKLCSNAYHQLMAFAGNAGPVFFRLDGKQKHVIACFFERIILEQDASYKFSHELFCNYINLILHEVLKKKTSEIIGYRPFHFN